MEHVPPRVTVIIPTFNRSARLLRAIASAREAGRNVEIVVVDDASTDDTKAVCEKLEDIKYIRLTRNQGQAAARNIGIQNSSGEFLAFLDDDDLRLPNSLEPQIRALDDDPDAAFVYGQVIFGDAQQCLPLNIIRPLVCPRGDLFWDFLEGNFIHMPSVIIRRKRLYEIGFFRTEFTRVEDWDMWIRLSERYPVTAVEHPVAIYRVATATSGQATSNLAAQGEVALKVQAEALRLPRAIAASSEECRRIRQRFLQHQVITLINDKQADNAKVWLSDLLSRESDGCLQKVLSYSFKLHPRLYKQLVRVQHSISFRVKWPLATYGRKVIGSKPVLKQAK